MIYFIVAFLFEIIIICASILLIMIEFIISQILGGIALILVCIGYFTKLKSNFLIIQIIANIFYAGSFLVQLSMVGGIITLVSTLRCIYLFICENRNFKYTIYFLPIFIVTYIIIGVIFYSGIGDIIPIFTGTLFTVAFYVKNLQLTRYICIVPNVLLIIYNIFCKTYTNALLDFVEVVVVIVAIVKHSKFYKNKKINNLSKSN